MPSRDAGQDLQNLYRARFDDEDLAFKQAMWQEFVDGFFQRYVAPTDTVVDLGAGSCEFINAIRCANKIAVDLNPDVETFLQDGKAVVSSSNDMSDIPDASVDKVFTSNFFEHLQTKQLLVETLRECHRILNEDGEILVVMPNIRVLPGRYWDYFDHHLALTPYSLEEVLRLTGFEPYKRISRFLPYTIKYTRIPRSEALVRLYMKMPFVWPIFGKQMFVAARRV
jgi:SAM-dependent methyltransferase